MEILNLDLNDNSLKDTPDRVAKMYVKELFDGLDPNLAPSISKFENSFEYNGCILEKNIPFYSLCEHHFVPIKGLHMWHIMPMKKLLVYQRLTE